MAKAPDAFRTISEVAEQLDTPAHVLRFWESKFSQVKPVKRAGGRRYYRPDDLALLSGIKALLHDQGMTIKGAQKVLRDRGAKAVIDMGRLSDLTPDDESVIDAVQTGAAEAPDIADTAKDGSPLPDLPDTLPDNIVALAGAATDTDAQQASDTPDNLPALPALRPLADGRIISLLPTIDRTQLAARRAAIAPLLDRLSQIHRRLTSG